MTVDEAIKTLKERKDWFHTAEKIGKNLYRVYYRGGYLQEDTMTAREIIKSAKAYSSENNQETAIKKNLKKYSNCKDRAATRDNLRKEEFDKIPSKKRVKEDDRWSWD
jgi:uncharacterized protein with WD repeat